MPAHTRLPCHSHLQTPHLPAFTHISCCPLHLFTVCATPDPHTSLLAPRTSLPSHTSAVCLTGTLSRCCICRLPSCRPLLPTVTHNCYPQLHDRHERPRMHHPAAASVVHQERGHRCRCSSLWLCQPTAGSSTWYFCGTAQRMMHPRVRAASWSTDCS